MKPRFLRCCLIIFLLTSSEAKIETHYQNILTENEKFNHRPKSKSLQNLCLTKNKLRGIHFPKSRHGKSANIKSTLFNKKLSSTNVLAEKLSKEALISPKIQEEFKRLKIVRADKRKFCYDEKKTKRKASVIQPIKAKKGYYKPILKDLKRKIRKKQEKHNSFKKVPTKIHQGKTIYKRRIENAIVKESMLERVMKTTTEDPNKKKPGDTGMEYSEYYNNDDDLKIRFERQIPKDKVYNVTNKNSPNGPSIDNKIQINQESYTSSYRDDDFLEDEVAFDGNEFNYAFSDSNQGQVQQARNLVYQQYPYFQADPTKYERLPQQKNVLDPHFQFFYPNQYNDQFMNSNQIFTPISTIVLKQIPNKDIDSSYKENLSKINQALDSEKELYSGVETTLVNSTISESTNFSSTEICTSTTNSISTICSTKKLFSTDDPFINPNDATQQQLNSQFSTSDTQAIANQILSKIVDELEDLKAVESKKFHKEGRPCRLSGSWRTSQAGIQLNIKVQKHTLIITPEKMESSENHEGFLNMTWNLSGQSPFKHGGPFSITGVNNKGKSLAVFVGCCRVCQGIDTIEGIWTVSREPVGCRDFQMATGIYNDIFRRIKHHELKEKNHNNSSTTEL